MSEDNKSIGQPGLDTEGLGRLIKKIDTSQGLTYEAVSAMVRLADSQYISRGTEFFYFILSVAYEKGKTDAKGLP